MRVVLTPLTASSRIQFVHDALETGKKGRDGVQSLDHAMSGTSALFANDKSPGTLDVGQLVRLGSPRRHDAAATDLEMETEAGKRRCASRRWKRIYNGRRRATRAHLSCRMNPGTQKKLHEEWHPPCSSRRSHRPGGFHITSHSNLQMFEVGHVARQNPTTRSLHNCFVLRGCSGATICEQCRKGR